MARKSTTKTGLENSTREKIFSSPVVLAFVRTVVARRGSPRPKPARFISTTSTEAQPADNADPVRSRDDVKRFEIQDGRPCKDIRWPADPVLVPLRWGGKRWFQAASVLAGLVRPFVDFTPA